jgi:hypothetical protein
VDETKGRRKPRMTQITRMGTNQADGEGNVRPYVVTLRMPKADGALLKDAAHDVRMSLNEWACTTLRNAAQAAALKREPREGGN